MGMITNRRELIQFAVTVWPAWVDLLCRKESPQERLRRTGVLRGETFEISETLVIEKGMSVSDCEITCARNFIGSHMLRMTGGSCMRNRLYSNGCQVNPVIFSGRLAGMTCRLKGSGLVETPLKVVE